MNKRVIRCLKKGGCILLGSLFIAQLYITIRIYWFVSCVIPTPSMSPTLIDGDYIIANLQIPGRRIWVGKEENFTKNKIYRKKGIRPIHRNEVVVFNFPYAEQDNKMVLSMKLFYCKRCVAIPGDNYISYKDGIPETWYIPKIGDEVELCTKNYMHYAKCIEYETGQPLVLKNDSILWNGKVLKQYVFKKNYYFMCGDNTENSYDSRYWGLLPEDFILGVGQFIWFSKDKKTGEIRWKRFFKRI